jgi:hypothetical protein
MPIPLGVLAVAGAGAGPAPAAGNAYEWLETSILGSDTADVTFSNLNSSYGSTYQHFQIRAVVRTDRAANEDIIAITFNGDSASNYVSHLLAGTGSSVVSQESVTGGPHTYIYAGFTATNNSAANAFSGHIIDILDPFETTKFKTIRQLFGHPAGNLVGLTSGLWRSTSAVTSIKLDAAIGTVFKTGSRFSLYGMRSS